MDSPSSPFITPWTLRALSSHSASVAVGVRKYKPVDRKVRPVPTYMPNPSAQKFRPIPLPSTLPLPHHPPSLSSFVPSARLSDDRLRMILSTVPDDFSHCVARNRTALVMLSSFPTPSWMPEYTRTFSDHLVFKLNWASIFSPLHLVRRVLIAPAALSPNENSN